MRMPGDGRKLYRESAVSYTGDSSVQYLEKTVRISDDSGENIRRRR
jgi:hypothetical protein